MDEMGVKMGKLTGFEEQLFIKCYHWFIAESKESDNNVSFYDWLKDEYGISLNLKQYEFTFTSIEGKIKFFLTWQ